MQICCVLETVGLNAVWILLQSHARISLIIVRENTFNFSGAKSGLMFYVATVYIHVDKVQVFSSAVQL